MLLYRKIAIISSEGVPRLLPIPVVTDDLVPQYIHDLVTEDLKQKEKQRKMELEILNRLKLRVYFDNKEYLIESNKTNTLTEFMRTIWQSIDLLGYIGADTVAGYMNEKNWYKEDDGKGESYVIPIGPNNAFASSEPCFDLFRLRLYNTFTHFRSDTYDVESQGSETLTSLGINEYKVFLVETRQSTEQWEVYYADGFTVIIVEYDPVTLRFKEPRSVRLKKFSILSELKAIIASWVTGSYAIDEIMLMKITPIGYNDVHINVLTKEDDGLRVKEDLGMYDGFRLYMDRKEALEAAIAEDEVTGSLTLGPASLINTSGITDDDVKSLKLNNALPPGSGEIKSELHLRPGYFSNAQRETKSKSGIIEAFLSHRNKLDLKIIKSADVSMEKTISVDGRISVAQLRQIIARECFNMSSGEDVRVFKQHCKGAELKDGTQTLIDLGLFNGINISAAIGKVTPAGFFSVCFMKYIAPVVGRTVLHQLPDLSNTDPTVDTTFDYGDDFDDDTIPHLIHIDTINSNNSTGNLVVNIDATFRGGDDNIDCMQNATSIVDLTYQDDAVTDDRESDASSNVGIADHNETPYFDDDDDDDDMGGMDQHAAVYPDVSLASNNNGDDDVYYTSSAIATAVPVEACIVESSSSSSSVATVVAEMVRPSNPFAADVDDVDVDPNSKDSVFLASVCNDDVEASGFGIAQVRHPHDAVHSYRMYSEEKENE